MILPGAVLIGIAPVFTGKQMINTVIFDIDGTLYDYDAANHAAMEAVEQYTKDTFGWDSETFRSAHKTAYDALMRATPTAARHDRLIRYTMMLEDAKLPLSHALAMDNLYWETLLADIHPFDHVKDAVCDLRGRGFQTGIGTNMTAYVQYLKLAKLELLDLFDFIVTSEETADEKPGPSVFQRCLERGHVQPYECLYVGDSFENDVLGAIKAGIMPILYDPRRTVKRTSPYDDAIMHITGFRELVPLCERLRDRFSANHSWQVGTMRTPQKDVDSRHQEILNRIRTQKEFRSEAFAQEYGISMMTVRRDLQLLEEQGFLKRTHGGAVAADGLHKENPQTSEVIVCRDAISRYAAFFVEDGDRLFINGSRTALNLLHYVAEKKVSVFTNNGWAIGEQYGDGVSVRLVGGDLHDRIMVGEFTMRSLLDMTADKTFIGCYAVYDDGSFSYSIPTEIGINEAMIGRTKDRLYIVADHTKLHSHEIRDTAYGSCTYDRPLTLITDSKANPEIIDNLRRLGIEIIQVPVDQGE